MRALLGALEQVQTIYQADDGQTALQIMAEHQPELVLLDFDISDNSPLSILIHIKEKWGKTRCIAVADSASKLNIAREAGADHTLLKGFLAGELFDTITRLFQQPRGFQHPIKNQF